MMTVMTVHLRLLQPNTSWNLQSAEILRFDSGTFARPIYNHIGRGGIYHAIAKFT